MLEIPDIMLGLTVDAGSKPPGISPPVSTSCDINEIHNAIIFMQCPYFQLFATFKEEKCQV